MIDKFLYKFFGYLDSISEKIDKVMTFDFSHCERPDCPKKKKKLIKNNKYFKS